MVGVTSALHLRRYLLRGIFGASSTEWCSRLWLPGVSRFHGQRRDQVPNHHGLLALIPEVEVQRPGLSESKLSSVTELHSFLCDLHTLFLEVEERRPYLQLNPIFRPLSGA